MPLRAFIDLDSETEATVKKQAEAVLMPLRAFIDLDQLFPFVATAWIRVLMPLRAFIDLDVICFPLCPIG